MNHRNIPGSTDGLDFASESFSSVSLTADCRIILPPTCTQQIHSAASTQVFLDWSGFASVTQYRMSSDFVDSTFQGRPYVGRRYNCLRLAMAKGVS